MIWLIDCWSVHISKEFREWMKNHHPKIHILYILANCTSIYQPADVIIQRPFKHAFRQAFNKYTMEAITKQLKAGDDVHMDFKISKLKSHICEWLYVAWTNVSSRIAMVLKGWEQTGLLRAFDKEFQKQAMLDNIKTPLFKTIEEEVQAYNTECNEEIDVEVSLDIVMEESLTKVVELLKCISSSNMSTIRNLARKK